MGTGRHGVSNGDISPDFEDSERHILGRGANFDGSYFGPNFGKAPKRLGKLELPSRKALRRGTSERRRASVGGTSDISDYPEQGEDQFWNEDAEEEEQEPMALRSRRFFNKRSTAGYDLS
eukprot:CAMPEP_0115033118 /NCGR_PEP_ID=MMETSP0216-20121206/39625_1 /TAXON_ID=223996 /ORGANISM="Protocruzia adherens, Strain Boccale" /LENGTH=119 /DNA_ID=CAMNT_0002411271 /DNA_START=34 /DNA_END=393 /DNA_ORIENTATION=-